MNPTSSKAEGPKVIIWILTGRCNLACEHCYAARFGMTKEMGPEQAERIVREAASTGVEYIGFSGGELLLRPDFLDLVDVVSRMGISTSMITNGTTMTPDAAKRLAANGTKVIFSVDGAGAELHDRVRGAGTWDRLMEGIEIVREAQAGFGTVMAVNKFNISDVEGVIEMTEEMGGGSATLIPVMPTGRATSELSPDAREWMTAVESAGKSADRTRFPVSLWCSPFTPLISDSSYLFSDCCRMDEGEINISPSGDVLLCDICDIALSNIVEKGLYGAWREQEESSVVAEMQLPTLSGACLDCPLNGSCRGGCYARAALINGDLYAPDPLCPKVAGLI